MVNAFENETTESNLRQVAVRVPPNVPVVLLDTGISSEMRICSGERLLVENVVPLVNLRMPVNEGKGSAIIVTFGKISPARGWKTSHLRGETSSPVFQSRAEAKFIHQNRSRRVANGAEFGHERVRIAVAENPARAVANLVKAGVEF